MKNKLLPLVLAACGGGAAQMAMSDATGTADAGPALTETPVTCTPYKRTLTYSDGSHLEYTYRYGLVNDVSPGDDYRVEECGYTAIGSGDCPTGYTCTGSTQPPGEQCASATRSGTFFGGHLGILCGYDVKQFNAAGAMTSITGYDYQTIKVFK